MLLLSNKPRLWMGLTKSVRGYHRNFAYWFLGHNKAIGFLRKYVTKDEKLNFHSFRHTFVNAVKQAMVDKQLVIELAGYCSRGETFGRYGKPYELRTKLDAMLCLEYSIDLEQVGAGKTYSWSYGVTVINLIQFVTYESNQKANSC